MKAVTLPLDRERPPSPSFLRETVSQTFVGTRPSAVTGLAAGFETSPFVVLLTAFNTVLLRWSGLSDLTVGAVLGTPGPDTETTLAAVHTQASLSAPAGDYLRRVSVAVGEAALHGGCPLESQAGLVASSAAGGVGDPLFRVAFGYEDVDLQRSDSIDFPSQHAAVLSSCDLVAWVVSRGDYLEVRLDYDAELFEPVTVARFVRHWGVVLGALVADPEASLGRLPLLVPEERQQLLVEWNDTEVEFPAGSCIHELIEAQVERTPDRTAAIFRGQEITYRELNCRANQLAHQIVQMGQGPDDRIGLFVERSLEMLVGLLAILKAGAAYVPLDPDYPRDRLDYMLQDAGIRVLLTQERLVGELPRHAADYVCLDTFDGDRLHAPDVNPATGVTSQNLAYVIYTSGSTGRPKGVLIEHRNVVNFFVGMDQVLGVENGGVWLAVTSISFDISVLELLWTLARGFTVVIHKAAGGWSDRPAVATAPRDKGVEFGFFYFASDESQDATSRYRLLLEGAKFGDQNGFSAVWTPERHFHAFGGLYPNPSVTGAAVAAVTRRVQIRAGSVVLPLQNPVRVAEEWSVVDNLSQGRVGISFAAGWQKNDFVLAPQNYSRRKELMFQEIETVQKLWRGESIALRGVDGSVVETRIFPRPVQPELPVWITATGNPETFRMAGLLGANILTHLVGQKLEDVAAKIALYRRARMEAGHSGPGCVSLMLHTFVGRDLDYVRETVREPFRQYLRTSVDLLKSSPWGFAPARRRSDVPVPSLSTGPVTVSDGEISALLDYAFEGYFQHSSLFGTPEICLQMVERLRAVGVNEVACLIDFGVETDCVLDSLPLLDEVRQRSAGPAGRSRFNAGDDLASLASRYSVTHFQCTPSMAGMLVNRPENAGWLGRLRHLLVGGEAFSSSLAASLKPRVGGEIHNMYGPTETTVWSTTQLVSAAGTSVSIGRPIANTQVYLLDDHQQPVPVGVTGELYIGGAGVVRGYWKLPDITEERFIPNPFARRSGDRLYRTGDLARYRADGDIEFLGRADQQVKLRGFRIELSEIEAVLSGHPSVHETAVVVREDFPGDRRLVAYVVTRSDSPQDLKALRAFLQERLPEFMVPPVIEFLDFLPRTPNGKVDRRALPPPVGASTCRNAGFEPPATPVEEALARLWRESLGRSQVGRFDNFFELGGHSLLAVQIASSIDKAFGISLPLVAFMEEPTLAGLASRVGDMVLASADTVALERLLDEIDGSPVP